MWLLWGLSFSPAIAVLTLHTQGWKGARAGSWAGWKLTPRGGNYESSDNPAPLPSHCVVALMPVLVPGVGDWEDGCSPKLKSSRVVSQLGRLIERHLAPGQLFPSLSIQCVLLKACFVLKGHRYVNKSNAGASSLALRASGMAKFSHAFCLLGNGPWLLMSSKLGWTIVWSQNCARECSSSI